MPDANAPAPQAKTKPTAEEHRQLLTHHMTKLRAKQAEVDELRAPLKEAQDEFTALINEAKADLGKGYTRKYLTTLLEDTTTRLRNLLEEEERRARDRDALGLPVFGVQADLFSTAGTDTERDLIHWEAEGYIRGRNGLLKEIQDGDPPMFHQAIMKGYRKGQEETLQLVQAAMELKKRQSEPDAAQAPVDLNADPPEPGAPEAQAAERKSVAAAKESLQNLGAGEPANELAA